jgi:hypothetical protein
MVDDWKVEEVVADDGPIALRIEGVCAAFLLSDAVAQRAQRKMFTLIASAPALLTELEETATWLGQRAEVLEEVGTAARATTRDRLLDEAARFRGRAAVIRQTILKATG